MTAPLISETGVPLLHDVAYYMLNQIPSGPAMEGGRRARGTETEPTEPSEDERRSSSQPADPSFHAEAPASWEGEVDRTVIVGTEPGLRYDRTEFTVPAGSRVELVFENSDDLLHNLVITRPGTAMEVAERALELGLASRERGYVPDTEDALFFTDVLEPESTDRIYFRAPQTGGEYPYVCTFPGHAESMNGVMRVR